MTTVRRFRTGKIAIFAGDHPPPHFHILGPEMAVVVEIATGRILQRSGRRVRVDEMLEWAEEHRLLLQAAWDRLNRREVR